MSQDEAQVVIRLTEDHAGHQAGAEIGVTPYIATKLVDRAKIAALIEPTVEETSPPAPGETPTTRASRRTPAPAGE